MSNDFLIFMVLTSVFGLSIFLSMPVVYWKRAQGRLAVFLNAGAIGILLFLMADIFSDVSPNLYTSTGLAGYVASGQMAMVFLWAFLGAFLALFAVDSDRLRRRAKDSGGVQSTAFIIATGIGLQNLTEGLVFGAIWVAPLPAGMSASARLGLLAVVFVGFFLQNVTEGFPIASPFLGSEQKQDVGRMAGLFFLGGVPTLLGGAIGYFFGQNPLLEVTFDALAIGAIAYAILPMLRVAFRPAETREASVRRNELVYLGVMIGFAIGFATNAI